MKTNIEISQMMWYMLAVWFLALVTWQMVRPKQLGEQSGAMRFIVALNSLNTPWVGITVMLVGMVFDIVCQKNNVSNDAATGVIGGGLGMLTAQALPRPPQSSPTPQPGGGAHPATAPETHEPGKGE